MDQQEIKKDFEPVEDQDEVLAVLMYGSQVTGDTHERSDIDICIVAPKAESYDVMSKVWNNVNTEKKNYDVHTFEELPLYIQKSVIEDHEIILTKDYGQLQEYLYRYRQIWKDQAKAKGIA